MRKSLPSMPSRTRLIAIAIAALLFSAVVIQQLYFARPAQAAISVFINEIHYDNTGTDAGEAIEIAGPAGTDLTGWSIVLYNGAGGAPYDTDALSGIIPNQQAGFGTVTLSYPSNGLQNGSPDGIALVNGTTVVQFLSYEGVFTAVGGAANGLVSTDIGVTEDESVAAGNSLRLTGTGSTYQSFTWNAAAASSYGSPNAGQTFVRPGDAAPRVSASSPADGASNVARNATLSVTFSESVTLADATILLTCNGTGVPVTVQSGPATTFEL